MFRSPAFWLLISILLLINFRIQLINGFPTHSQVHDREFNEGFPPDVIWPSYVAHLSQAQPNRTFGPKQFPLVYRVPSENHDIGTQIAFTMPRGDGNDRDDSSGDCLKNDEACDDKFKNDYAYKRDENGTKSNYMCELAFLDLNAQWGPAKWATKVPQAQDFTVFGYLEAEVIFGPEDTWNNQPDVDYNITYAVVHINSTGVHITAGALNCTSNVGVAHFWLQAVGNQSCDLKWLEAVQPFSGLVIQRYSLS